MRSPAHLPVSRPVDIGEVARVLATLPARTLASHRTAAQLWGLWIPPFDGIELTTPAGERGSRYTTSVQRNAVIAHRRLIGPADTTTLHGVPITTIARTWFDTAISCADIYDMVALGDSALRAGASLTDLAAVAEKSRGVRGRRLAQSSIPLLDARARSRPESRLRSALVIRGLPKPEVNQPVHDAYGQWIAEPDLLYREARVALEYNGSLHGEVEQMRKDSVRLLDLQRAGWEVRTYTARHVFRSLEEVVADVRELLLRRAPELLVRAQQGRQFGYPPHRVTSSVAERRRKYRHSA